MTTRHEVALAEFLTFLTVAIASWLIFPISLLAALGYTAALTFVARLAGYCWGYSVARSKLAVSEDYGAKVAEAQQAAAQDTLREQLSPEGRLAYDTVQREIEELGG